jgi:hypothetical protein
MTYNERNLVLQSEDFIGKVRIAMCDWVEYWAVNGTASIEDPELKEKTDTFITLALSNPDAYVRKLATLVIAETAVKEAVEVTDLNVKTAVDDALSHALDYLM